MAHTAIGTHTREVAAVLRAMGLRTHAYVTEARGVPLGRLQLSFRSYRGPAAGEPTWLLYQLSTGSPIANALQERSEPLIVNYHNITPAPFFRPWEPLVARELAARKPGPKAAPPGASGSLAIADSSFNQAEMRSESGVPPSRGDPGPDRPGAAGPPTVDRAVP